MTAGSFGNFDGRPAAMLADSSSERATCSTIWLGDHLPGARDVVHAGPELSAASINWSVASLHAERAALISAIASSVARKGCRAIVPCFEFGKSDNRPPG